MTQDATTQGMTPVQVAADLADKSRTAVRNLQAIFDTAFPTSGTTTSHPGDKPVMSHDDEDRAMLEGVLCIGSSLASIATSLSVIAASYLPHSATDPTTTK